MEDTVFDGSTKTLVMNIERTYQVQLSRGFWSQRYCTLFVSCGLNPDNFTKNV